MNEEHGKSKLQGYQRICRLGVGSFGSVYLYQRLTPKPQNPFNDFFVNCRVSETEHFALKRYNRPENNKEGIDFSALREINLLLTLRHPNIVECYDVIYRRTNKKYQIYLVMDFLLQLNDVVQNQSIVHNQLDRKNICYQILKGIDFLHQHHIFHRDLKPGNIFFSRSGYVKIGDFGFAKQFGTPHKQYTPQTCTKQYRAPQLFFGTYFYNQKSDIWSYGCTVSQIFTNKTLFPCESSNDLETLGRIFYLRGTPNENVWTAYNKFPKFCNFEKTVSKDLAHQLQVSKDVANFLDLCLQLDPKKRPSARQLLKHPFFQDVEDRPLSIQKYFDNKLDDIVSKSKTMLSSNIQL